MIPVINIIDDHNADIITGSGKIEIRGAKDWRDAARGYKLGPNGHTWEFDGVGAYRVRYVQVTDGVVTDVVWSETGDAPAVGCIESQDADVGWTWDGSTLNPPAEG